MKKEEKNSKTKIDIEDKLVFFATGNFHKYNEAKMILEDYGFSTAMLNAKTVEIQDDSLEAIAKTSVIEAFRLCNLSMFVEDAGLFVDSLRGFPGPYAAYVYKTISNPGLLKLMEKIRNRKATFQSVIAYYNGTAKPTIFIGETNGEIAAEERWGKSKAGFGFDPIFIPEGSQKTFAEMEIEEKNQLSHRAKSVHKFAEWLCEYNQAKTS